VPLDPITALIEGVPDTQRSGAAARDWCASPARYQVVPPQVMVSGGPGPLVAARGKQRARTPRAFRSNRGVATERWSNAHNYNTAPAVKTPNPCPLASMQAAPSAA
jgi:hypothetical protein